MAVPELPEVETIRRYLANHLPGRAITAASSHESAKFTPAIDATGAGIEQVGRRGKYLIVGLDDDRELVIHLGMTGQLLLGDSANRGNRGNRGNSEQVETDDYVRASWQLDDGRSLVFRDVRRFGRIRVVDAGEYSSIATLHALGPEPDSEAFTGAHLHQALNASSRRIKTQLLSQRPVAGVGNIYADEALWLARVHPAARRISKPAAARLRDAIAGVMASAIERGGTTLRDYRNAEGAEGENQFYLRCYGRAEEPCERCGTLLRSYVWDARTTTWCTSCQTR